MNQILSTKLKNKTMKIKKITKKFFKLQFITSILLMIISIISIIYYISSLQKKEKISNTLLGTYNIYQLYRSNSKEAINQAENQNSLFGILEIPKINLYYPIFSRLNEELLKISPCKFYGESPKVNGNICIAGHNYNNSMFFSNIHLLDENDEIYFYDTLGQKYIYKILVIYEVHESDLSPIFNYDSSVKQLTLVTCNNLNSKRIIVKALQE